MTGLLGRLLEDKPYLLADGAMGTTLFGRGLASGEAPEFWVVDRPEEIVRVHREFVDAGADIILTDSFGANRHRLKLHGAEDRVGALNEAAAAVARRVADEAGRPVAVAGSMGPTGELLEPLGPLTAVDAAAAFAEQAAALAAGGVDALWLETLSSPAELDAAVKGAAETGLPIVCTMTFDSAGRTMMGLSPADYAELCRGLAPRPIAYGANCGVGAAELLQSIHAMLAISQGDVLVAKANCGIPAYVDGELVYSGTVEVMAEYAVLARDLGVRIVGGCCGTTAAHIRAMREAIDNRPPGPVPDLDRIAAILGAPWGGADVAGARAADRPRRGRGRRRA